MVKITGVTLTMFSWPKPRSMYAKGPNALIGDTELAVVSIQTDGGVTGNSFLGGVRRSADINAGPLLTYLKPVLMGENPLDTGRLWHEMCTYKRFVSRTAICALDIALWDLAGKVAKLPIHRLLGSCRDKVHAYAASSRYPTPEDYADEAISVKAWGWTAYKIHPHRIPKEDIAICRAVRKAVGDDMVLMLDVAWGYGYEDAVRVGRAIEELNFFWYEDPLAADDIYNYVKLRQKLDIPIMATENASGGLYGLSPYILQGATDILRGDVTDKGGITPMIKIAHLAEAFRMKCECHHGSNSLNNAATLHVIMAIKNCDYFEVILPDSVNKYGLVHDIEVDSQGLVHAPEEPGLGYEIDWELVKRKATRTLS